MKEKNTMPLWKALTGKMKDDKKFEAAVYITILIFAVLLYLLFGKTPSEKDGTENIKEGGVEDRLELALERMQGVGDVHVMISYSGKEKEQIDGVIVIADGAGDIMTRGSIQSAVHTLLGIEAEKVGVYKMKEKTEVE